MYVLYSIVRNFPMRLLNKELMHHQSPIHITIDTSTVGSYMDIFMHHNHTNQICEAADYYNHEQAIFS